MEEKLINMSEWLLCKSFSFELGSERDEGFKWKVLHAFVWTFLKSVNFFSLFGWAIFYVSVKNGILRRV